MDKDDENEKRRKMMGWLYSKTFNVGYCDGDALLDPRFDVQGLAHSGYVPRPKQSHYLRTKSQKAECEKKQRPLTPKQSLERKRLHAMKDPVKAARQRIGCDLIDYAEKGIK